MAIGEVADSLDRLDWVSAVAEASFVIDNWSQTSADSLQAYYYRGVARCFITDKDNKYKDAIKDLTIALNKIHFAPPPPPPAEEECLCRRAYAYWLASRFDEAIADCQRALAVQNCPDEWQTFAHELLGAVHEQLGETREAVHEYRAAITLNRNGFGLLERYRLAREKLNRG
jgi:tetratricopeptide (TPR) repeat protein